MSATTNHWKLGLFVLLGSATLLIALLWVGAARLERQTVESLTYFDSDVHGLEVGAPVKFRGVTVGRVSAIGFAPDHRHVRVAQTIYVDALRELGLRDHALSPEDGPFVPPDVRVHLESSLLTGVAFLEGDFFDVERYPVPEYPFPIPWNVVHPVPSPMESLEDGLITSLEELPDLLSEAALTMTALRTTLDTLDVDGTQQRLKSVLDEVDRRLRTLEEFPLFAQGRATLAESEAGLRELRGLVAELRDGEGPVRAALRDWTGLARTLEAAVAASDLPATTAALRAVGGEVEDSAGEAALLISDLRRELQDVRSTLDAFRALAETLERDPASLLYGRTPPPPLTQD